MDGVYQTNSLGYQTDKAAATTLIPLSKAGAEELEVAVLEEEQQPDEQHPAGEQDEGTCEVEYPQRHAWFALGVVLLAHAGKPELLQSFHFTFKAK